MSLEAEIRDAINRHSAENGSDTPDFILAQYLIGCLNLFDVATVQRENWYGRNNPRWPAPAVGASGQPA